MSNGDKRDRQQAAEWRPVRPESGDRSTKGIEAHMRWQGLGPGAWSPYVICSFYFRKMYVHFIASTLFAKPKKDEGTKAGSRSSRRVWCG